MTRERGFNRTVFDLASVCGSTPITRIRYHTVSRSSGTGEQTLRSRQSGHKSLSTPVLINSSTSKMAQAPTGGDQNKAPGILVLAWIEFSISLIVVVLRLFTRALIVRHVGLDDVFIVVTLVSGTSDGK